MKLIPLTRGKFAMVDDADYAWLNQWKWCALPTKTNWYAMRSAKTASGKFVTAMMHRIIIPSSEVDHKDGNGLNNQRKNLRSCNRIQNCRNRKISSRNTSGFKGVRWDKIANKWFAYLRMGKNVKYLGWFNKKIDAAIAYNKGAKKYFGEFAKLNNLRNLC